MTPPQSNDFNTSQIQDVVDHPYFKTLLEHRVQVETNAHLDRWMKRIAAPAILAVTVAGYLGYRDIADVRKLTEDAATKIDKAQSESNQLLEKIRIDGKSADDLFHSSQEQLGKVAEAKGAVEAGNKYLADSQRAAQNIANLQSEAVKATIDSQKTTTQQAFDLSEKQSGSPKAPMPSTRPPPKSRPTAMPST
jgi:hypothetical protein